jgi:hypothetical protein
MTKIQGLLSGLCMVVLAAGPGIAHAQGYPESTPEACSDRVDNDGDGAVDCYDADCRGFAFCQQAAPPPGYQPPPPGYQPPPPGYQPPPTYYVPRPVYNYVQPPPPKGVADVIVGFVLLGMGLALGIGSYPLWDVAFSGSGLFSSSTKTNYLIGAIIADIFATGMLIVGVILVPSGFGKMARYNEWKKRRAAQGQPVSLFDYKGIGFTPTIGLAPTVSGSGADGASFGLKVTF